MSSHHIVRDEQEPALLILEPNSVDFHIIQELLEWNPTVIVLENVVEEVLNWEIKIDVVFCKSINYEKISALFVEKMEVKIISTEEDLKISALAHLQANHYQTVSVLAEIEDFEWLLSFLKDLTIILYFKNFKGFHVHTTNWSKWFTKNITLKIIANDFTASNLISTNKQYFYKTQDDGFVEIISNEKSFWIFEEIH